MRADDNAIRIYFADEVTKHKLYTLMHDTMYRTGVASGIKLPTMHRPRSRGTYLPQSTSPVSASQSAYRVIPAWWQISWGISGRKFYTGGRMIMR